MDSGRDYLLRIRWQNGFLTDLGSLAGTNNSGSAWISSNGIIAGLSENGQIDPSVSGLPEISAVMWRDGKITNLGMLPGGGYQSAALNNRAEAAQRPKLVLPESVRRLLLRQLGSRFHLPALQAPNR